MATTPCVAAPFASPIPSRRTANASRPALLLARLLGALWLCFAVAACSKSVEGEQKKWDANVAQVRALTAKYPGFKAALEGRLARAQTIYDAAGSLGDEAKIEKMSEANNTISAGFVHDLEHLDETLKKLREARVEAAAKAGDESSRLAAKVAADDAGKTIDRVDATLATGAKDEAGADAVLKKIVADIATAQSAIDKVVKVDRDKADDAKAKADAEAKSKVEAEAKVAPWKCPYCGAENSHEHGACTGCGAPRSDKKSGDSKAK